MLAKPSRPWLAAIAAGLLLLGSSVPALERLSCSMGCPTLIAVGQVEDCCPGEGDHSDGPAIYGDCCDVERAALAHDAFIPENARTGFICVAEDVQPIRAVALRPVAVISGYRCSSRPPPLLAADRLSRVCSFLI